MFTNHRAAEEILHQLVYLRSGAPDSCAGTEFPPSQACLGAEDSSLSLVSLLETLQTLTSNRASPVPCPLDPVTLSPVLCRTPLTWFWCLQLSGRLAALQEDQQEAEQLDGGSWTAAVPTAHCISTLLGGVRSVSRL